MDTKEQLRETSEQLKESIKDTFSNLKDYGKAVATHTGATIKQGVSNLKERFLSFKEGIKQKASTTKAKLGTIKTTALEKLNPHNLDVKFRDLVEKVEIAGLEVAHKGKEAVIEAKDRVVDLYATQAANYYLRQEEKEQERLEQERIREEQRAREAEIKANSREHKIGMKEALKEQDRNQREARRLQFRESVKEKVSSAKGKLGKLKTGLLEKLNPNNLDVKFRDLVERVEIKGLEVAHKGKEAVIEAKDRVVDFAAQQAANYYLRQEEKEQERLEQERIREEQRAREAEIKANSREHKIGMKEALKEQDRKQREARRLQFRESVKEKVSSAKGKLGKLKTGLLEKLNPHNLDVKFRDLVERVEIKGLEVAHKGKEAVIEAKDRVVDFAAQQAANYYLRQEEKEQERLEQERIREEERAREAEIRENSREHKIGMKEALKEQDRQKREARRLQFRENIVQKTNSVKSKLGKIKTNLLEKLRSAKDKVTDFFAEKAAEHYLRQEERQIEKEFKLAQKEAEREEIEKAKARIRERKKDVAYALNAEEREMYEQRHLDNQAKKEELMRQLFGEKEEQEVVRTARAL